MSGYHTKEDDNTPSTSYTEHEKEKAKEEKTSGLALLSDPMLNRGTAFTPKERDTFDLIGLLPPAVMTLDEQTRRSYAQYQQQPDDFAKNIYLSALQDRNEVLFYRLLSEHLAETLPVVYDPTVALAIERYSHEYRRPRGVYLSIDHPEDIEASLRVWISVRSNFHRSHCGGASE